MNIIKDDVCSNCKNLTIISEINSNIKGNCKLNFPFIKVFHNVISECNDFVRIAHVNS